MLTNTLLFSFCFKSSSKPIPTATRYSQMNPSRVSMPTAPAQDKLLLHHGGGGGGGDSTVEGE